MKPPTNHLEPRRTEPALWALHELCGLSLAEIARRAHLSPRIAHDVWQGMAASVRVRDRLLSVLKSTLAEMTEEIERYYLSIPQTLRRTRFEEYRPYRSAVFAEINRVLSHPIYEVSPATKSLRKILELKRHVTRAECIDLMTPMSHNTTRRAAKRLGVVTYLDERGRECWRLPPRAGLEIPPQTRLPLRRRMSRVWVIVERLLTAQPVDDQGYSWVSVQDIQRAVDAAGFTRQLLYRAARYMGVERRTEGFGPSKKTYWSYQKKLS